MILQPSNVCNTIRVFTDCIAGTLSANQKLNTNIHQVDLVVQSFCNGVYELNLIIDNGMLSCR